VSSPRAIAALLGALLSTLLGVSPAVAGQRVVNGTAPSQPWPAQASVRFKRSGAASLCGGTLVSARWVLTSGHCATDTDGTVLAPKAFNDSKDANRLRVGSTSRTTGGTAVDVDRVEREPSYTNPPATVQPTYDLALLHLATPMPSQPLALIGSQAADQPFWSPGVEATILGWGQAEGTAESPTLVEGRVPIVADASCAATWGAVFSAQSMLCAGGATTTDTCNGDSGGPLMTARNGVWTLVGVTSWGFFNCDDQTAPGVYARLGDPSIDGWIRGLVPTVSVAVSTAAAVVSQPVDFAAAAPSTSGAPSFSWDTNGDGTLGDAAGPTASAAFTAPGTYAVGVQASYPDGDHSAISRTFVTVTSAGPPPSGPAPGGAGAATGRTTNADGTTGTANGTSGAYGTGATTAKAKNGVTVSTTMRLTTLRASGVRVRYQCLRACSISGQVKLGPALARRFHLGTGKTSATVASGKSHRTAKGSAVLTMHLGARAKRALRSAARITLSVQTTLHAGASTQHAAHAVAVRR
jgi:secreted trypsin-like serine protease